MKVPISLAVYFTLVWLSAMAIYMTDMICHIKGRESIIPPRIVAIFWFIIGVVIGGVLTIDCWFDIF